MRVSGSVSRMPSEQINSDVVELVRSQPCQCGDLLMTRQLGRHNAKVVLSIGGSASNPVLLFDNYVT